MDTTAWGFAGCVWGHHPLHSLRSSTHPAENPPHFGLTRFWFFFWILTAHLVHPLQPVGGVQNAAENLGEHLMGDTIQNSDYDVSATLF